MLEAILLITAAAANHAGDAGDNAASEEIMARNISKAIKLAAEHPNSTICTRVYKTGSRLKFEKVCMSSQAWHELQGQTKQIQRDIVMRAGFQG